MPTWWRTSSTLPGRAGRTRLRSARLPQSSAAVTVPVEVVKPRRRQWPGVPLAHELADVVFAEARHLRRPGVAQVRVVGPDHDPGLPAALAAEVA